MREDKADPPINIRGAGVDRSGRGGRKSESRRRQERTRREEVRKPAGTEVEQGGGVVRMGSAEEEGKGSG